MANASLVLLRLRMMQLLHTGKSLPWHYRLLACLGLLGGLVLIFLAATQKLALWLILSASPFLTGAIRRDGHSVLRRLERPQQALFFESLPITVLWAIAGISHYWLLGFVPLLLAWMATYGPSGWLRFSGSHQFLFPASWGKWLGQEGRSLWRRQAPWGILLIILTLCSLGVPVLSLWLTAVLTLMWSGPVLQCESWLVLRASGLPGRRFFFHQLFRHALPLGVWSVIISILHAGIHPELAWMTPALLAIQSLYLTLVWAIRYAYWRPSEITSGNTVAAIAAIGMLIPVMAPVLIIFLLYYLPLALRRLQHELLP